MAAKRPQIAKRPNWRFWNPNLPKGLSDEELSEIVRQAVKETGASSPKQMGQVMGAVMKKLAGQAVDGKKVQELVKTLLV